MFFFFQKRPTNSKLCAGAVRETPSDLMTMVMTMIIEWHSHDCDDGDEHDN